jgi:hypothetical protein
VVLCVKLTEAEPAELVLAFATFHELAAFTPHDHDMAGGALLSKKYFI